MLTAAEDGDEPALQRLLEQVRRPAQLLKATDDEGYTALHLAALKGHEGCLRHLVAKQLEGLPWSQYLASGRPRIELFPLSNTRTDMIAKM